MQVSELSSTAKEVLGAEAATDLLNWRGNGLHHYQEAPFSAFIARQKVNQALIFSVCHNQIDSQ